MANKNKIVLIGWDGADWQHITPLLDQGLLPGLESLINRGVMGNLATLQPVLSPMLWNSIATGKTADKHGIHGFVEPTPDRSGVRPSTSTSRTTKAIWNILNQQGWKSNIVGWWASYPAEPIRGNIVTNLYNAVKRDPNGNALIGPHVIHPESRATELADYKVDISEITENDIGPFCPNYMKVDQTKDRRLANLAKLLSDMASIQSVTTVLMEEEWDFTAVYFDSIDHFCHGFMHYHPPRMPNISEADFEIFKDVINGAYRMSDMMLQRIISLCDQDTTIVLCSDHGFQSGSGRPLVTPMEPAGPALWHRNHGIVVMAGSGIKQDQRINGANVIDITPTLLHAAGLPVGKDMDGRVLTDAFIDPTPPQYIASWDQVDGDSGMHPAGYDIFDKSEPKQDDLINQFVALGYIEDPGDDKEQAAKNAELELKYNLARVFYTTNRYEQALELFQQLVAESPWEDRFWKNLAYCCSEIGQYKLAQQIINKLYEDSERMPPFSKLILAKCAWEFGDREQTLQYVESLLSTRHRVANIYASLGQLLVTKIRDFEKAEKAFEACIQLDADYAVAYEGLAGIYLRTGRYEQCVEAALNAVTLLYRLPKSHYYLGVALHAIGELDSALVALERVKSFGVPRYTRLANRNLIQLSRKQNPLAKVDELLAEQKSLRVASRSKRKSRPEIHVDLSKIPTAKTRREINDKRRNKKKQTVEKSGKTFLIVSGLPRSGTSLMMQMLTAGGIEPQTDGIRQADTNNPKGYLEWEEIKKIQQSPEILDAPDIEDRAIKVISMLLPALPSHHHYKVIFMVRPIDQIARSQRKMIERLDADGPEADLQSMALRLEMHRKQTLHFLEKSDHFDLLEVDYEALLANADQQLASIVQFVGQDRLDISAMPSAIHQDLHREK